MYHSQGILLSRLSYSFQLTQVFSFKMYKMNGIMHQDCLIKHLFLWSFIVSLTDDEYNYPTFKYNSSLIYSGINLSGADTHCKMFP